MCISIIAQLSTKAFAMALFSVVGNEIVVLDNLRGR